MALAALIALSPSCSAGDDDRRTTRTTQQTPEHESFTEMFVGYALDEPLYATTQELAARSAVVVTGTIESIDDGRTFGLVGEPDLANFTTLLMRVRVRDVLGGNIRTGFVLVELPAPGRRSAETFEDAVPANTEVVLYLSKYSPDSPGDSDYVIAFGSTWPSDDSVYVPTNSQGFVVQESGTVAAPLGGPLTYDVGTTLSEFLPKGGQYPAGQTGD